MGVTEEILSAVQVRTGMVFSGYRPQTAERRIRGRMTSLGIDDSADYARLLHNSSDEVHLLIERLTIKVSRFYRNPQVFDALRCDVLPTLARQGRPLRLWSAGCGRGEEAYTLAMLLEEAGVAGEVVATDIDPLALDAVREGRYNAAALVDLPETWAARFLRPCDPAALHYEVDDILKRRVVVATAHLATSPGPEGAPFDLVCCRNVLIYWDAATQRAMLDRLLARLQGGGWLCLGEAEWLDPVALGLEVVAARLRLFRRRATQLLE